VTALDVPRIELLAYAPGSAGGRCGSRRGVKTKRGEIKNEERLDESAGPP
jgi:hypothetical protein